MSRLTKAPTYTTTRAEAEAKLAEFNAQCDKRGVPQVERDRWLAEAKAAKERGAIPPVPVWATKPYGSLPTSPSLLLPPEIDPERMTTDQRELLREEYEEIQLMNRYNGTPSPTQTYQPTTG